MGFDIPQSTNNAYLQKADELFMYWIIKSIRWFEYDYILNGSIWLNQNESNIGGMENFPIIF